MKLKDFASNKNSAMTIHILRNWERDKIVEFAKHLIGEIEVPPVGVDREEVKRIITEFMGWLSARYSVNKELGLTTQDIEKIDEVTDSLTASKKGE